MVTRLHEFVQQRLQQRNETPASRDHQHAERANDPQAHCGRDGAALPFIDENAASEPDGERDRFGFALAEIDFSRKIDRAGNGLVENDDCLPEGKRDRPRVRAIRVELRLPVNRARNQHALEDLREQGKPVEPPERDQRAGVRDDDLSQTPRSPARALRESSAQPEFSELRAGQRTRLETGQRSSRPGRY